MDRGMFLPPGSQKGDAPVIERCPISAQEKKRVLGEKPVS
jgi:hypothetical protein